MVCLSVLTKPIFFALCCALSPRCCSSTCPCPWPEFLLYPQTSSPPLPSLSPQCGARLFWGCRLSFCPKVSRWVLWHSDDGILRTCPKNHHLFYTFILILIPQPENAQASFEAQVCSCAVPSKCVLL